MSRGVDAARRVAPRLGHVRRAPWILREGCLLAHWARAILVKVWAKISAVHIWRRAKPSEDRDRWVEVDAFHKIRHKSRRKSGCRDNERNARAKLKVVVLSPYVVLPEGPAVVPDEGNNGVLCSADRFDLVQKLPDEKIGEANTRHVRPPKGSCTVRWQRRGRIGIRDRVDFVKALECGHAVAFVRKRDRRHPLRGFFVKWERDGLGRCIKIPELSRAVPWQVGSVSAKCQEEWFGLIHGVVNFFNRLCHVQVVRVALYIVIRGAC
mmetsp:Transcript_1151/g.3939  ORF Transcript_1151/g.3939 Transcript_1151/m.3939 type:complete len:266 (+) Transcript_1151:131-928(+)